MKRLTALLLCVVGLALAGCAGTKGSGTSSNKTCAIHHVPLQKKKVSISYGLPMWSEYDRKMIEESSRSFPHSTVQVEGGCDVMENAPKEVTVWQCPKCVQAKAEWMKQHPRPEKDAF